jgi:hypothetical protein
MGNHVLVFVKWLIVLLLSIKVIFLSGNGSRLFYQILGWLPFRMRVSGAGVAIHVT